MKLGRDGGNSSNYNSSNTGERLLYFLLGLITVLGVAFAIVAHRCGEPCYPGAQQHERLKK